MHRSTEQLLTKLNVTHDFLEITRLSLLPKIVPRRLMRGREGLLLSIRPHRRTVSSSVFPSADRNCPHIDNNPSKFDLNQNAAHCKLNNSFWCRACCCHKVFPPKKHIYTFTFLTFPKLPYSALCESESFMFLSVFQTPSLTLLNLLLSSLIKRNGGRHLSVDTLQTNLKKKRWWGILMFQFSENLGFKNSCFTAVVFSASSLEWADFAPTRHLSGRLHRFVIKAQLIDRARASARESRDVTACFYFISPASSGSRR